MDRDFDLVLYGATGDTGRQAAAYLTANAPSKLRWAIAGRDRAGLALLDLTVPALVADSGNGDQLDALAVRARVVLNMAGPFRKIGDPLVEACIRQGTHYCDISGETARIRDLIDHRHTEAAARRVRIVPFCGASSVPVDLAVHLLTDRSGERRTRIKAALRLTGGSFGAGTIASIGEAVTSGDATRERNPFLLGPDRAVEPLERDPRGVRYDRDLRVWTIFSPLGVSDTRAVRRSAVLRGCDITFQEYLAFGEVARAVATWSALGGFRAALRWGPTRSIVRRLAGSGSQPAETPPKGSYDLRVVTAAGDEVRVYGIGDAGNRITVICAAECALTLALDEAALPEVYGVLTPSIAMGDALLARLGSAGLSFERDRLDPAPPRGTTI